MNVELFVSMLLAVSLMTSLVVEGIKKMLEETGKGSRPNILAAVVSVILSAAAYAGYSILTQTAFTAHGAVFLIALIVAAWLCAMLGYDKVVQTIKQMISNKTEQEDERL